MTIRFGVFEVDFAAAELRKRGRRVKLEAQPFQVLSVLVRRAGELVTREELQREVWPGDTFVEFDHSLNTAVKKIRQALDDSPRNPRYVETVPRQGYRFIGEVEEAAKPATATRTEPPKPVRPVAWVASLVAVGVVAATIAWFAARSGGTDAEEFRVVPLTSYPGDEQRPSFSPDGGEVAFQWNRDGNWDIYIKQIGAEQAFQLTSDPADEFGPAWSPLGDQIAFLRYRTEPSRMQVLRIPQRGGTEQLLAEFNGHVMWSTVLRNEFGALAWTPDGQWLIVAGQEEAGGPNSLYRISASSGEKLQLTSPPSGSADQMPAVSPDGRTLIFSRSGELWALPLAEDYSPGDNARRLPLDSQLYFPAWTPDGREIIFSSPYFGPSLRRLNVQTPNRSRELLGPGNIKFQPAVSAGGSRMAYVTTPATWNIWQVNLSAGEERRLTPFSAISSSRNDGNPQYSPDGRRIAFDSSRTGVLSVWVCNSDGTDLLELASGGAWRPRWSPDGQQVAFQATREGQQDIFVVNARGGSSRQLTTHPLDDNNVEWSRDGKWIYFLSRRDGTKRTWKVPAGGGEPLPTDLLGGTAGEFPDGKYFYYERDWEVPEKYSLWRVPVAGGESEKVVEPLSQASAFQVVEDGVYYIERRQDDGTSRILFKHVDTEEIETLAVVEETTGWGLTVSPDRKNLLYVQQDRAGSDLMLVKNFR